jgi:hypothetical protein|eukprot:COSAG01_NODE_886_length_12921_cov_115.252652_2_plen_60_part_00
MAWTQDDNINAKSGFAENCQLDQCEHDMGLTAQDMQDLQSGWATMMNRCVIYCGYGKSR